jgi:hypothetical protein
MAQSKGFKRAQTGFADSVKTAAEIVRPLLHDCADAELIGELGTRGVRRGLAESSWGVGEEQRADELFRTWLDAPALELGMDRLGGLLRLRAGQLSYRAEEVEWNVVTAFPSSHASKRPPAWDQLTRSKAGIPRTP